MNHFFCLLCFGILSCNPTLSNVECPKLNSSVASDDKIDEIADADIGGDDDLWTANDFKVYKLRMGKFSNEIINLNDYNLQTSYQSKGFNSNNGDTISVLIDFSSMKGIKKDTAILINEFEIFNGDRKSLASWNNSIKVKDMTFSYHGKCIGNTTLNNTFKMQWVNLEENSIPILSGSIDTIQIIIKSVYPSNSKATNYSLSEIKFTGLKNY